MFSLVPSTVQNASVSNIHSDSFILWWQTPRFANGILKAYHIQVKKLHQLYVAPSWCRLDTGLVKKITLSGNTFSYQIKDLDPFTEYAIDILASTSVGLGSNFRTTVTTLPAGDVIVISQLSEIWFFNNVNLNVLKINNTVSAPVTQLECTQNLPHSYTVTWRQPCRTNGLLKLFLVMVTGTRNHHPDDTFSYSIIPNVSVNLG